MGNDLTARATAKAAERGLAPTANGGEVAQPAGLETQIRNHLDEFKMAMPRGLEATQLVRDAITALRRVPNLSRCDRMSVLGSLMTCAQLGLRPNTPLGHAWVLPFWNNKAEFTDEHGRTRKGRYEAQLIIGYQGYRELVQRTGVVQTVIAHVVHENDEFDVEYGLDEKIVHRPMLKGPRGAPAGYYAIIKYTTGGWTLAHMTKDEAEEHRDLYAMARSRDGRILGPWRDNFDAMALKTVFLKAAKWAPKSTELAYAIEADGRIRVNANNELEAMAEGVRPGDERDTDGTPGAPAGSDIPDGDWVDGEVVDGPRDDAPPVHDVNPPAATPDLQTEFSAVAGEGTDDPASQPQQRAMSAMLGKAGVKDDVARHAVLSRIAGRTTPVKSAGELTKREASQIIDHLNRWQDENVMTEQVAAVRAAAQAAATPPEAVAPAAGEKLPDVGTRAWHDDGHPALVDGKVVRADKVLTGDCGICEQPEDGS